MRNLQEYLKNDNFGTGYGQPQLLLCGGNVSIGEVSAERINLKQISRDEIVPILNDSLKQISKSFSKMNGLPLWDDKLIKSKEFLSGSAFHFFDLKHIDSNLFVSKKPTIGDVDTQVDVLLSPLLEDFLIKSVGKTYGDLTLVGHKNSAGQFISLWYCKQFNINIQIDFELVDFKNGKPTEWSNFSHSSSWADIVEGIKGLHHKFLMQSLAADKKEPIIILTGKTRKPKETDKTKLAFSVQKGLRLRYVPHLDDAGNIVKQNGKPVYDEIDAKDSVIHTELETIFDIYFERKATKSDIDNMKSFIGLIKLIKQYKSHAQIVDIFDDYIDRLFSKGAQGIVKGNPLGDYDEKYPGVYYFSQQTNINLDKYKQMIAEYYKNYKV
jgi:hypothetical protein